MSIDACIAHAIQSDLDILEVLPEVQELPVEELEPYIERFVTLVHQSLRSTITEKGEAFIMSRDAAGLCATCLESGVTLPPRTLLRMCQTIVQLSTVDATFILDTEDGTSLYYMKMTIA